MCLHACLNTHWVNNHKLISNINNTDKKYNRINKKINTDDQLINVKTINMN